MYDFQDQEPEERSRLSQFFSQLWQNLRTPLQIILHFVLNGLNRLKRYLSVLRKSKENNTMESIYDSDQVFTDFPDEYISFNNVPLHQEYRPPLKDGLVLHSAALIIIASGFAAAFITALNQDVGNYFLLYLLLSLILLVPLPVIIYRGYALLRARYLLNREGLLLRWGLRSEDIPLQDIEWIRSIDDFDEDIAVPPLSVPGAIIGVKRNDDLGLIEFMASDRESLLLIATSNQIYAISPDDPKNFLYTYQRSIELGSLAPIESQSVFPAAFLKQFWQDRTARMPILTGLIITIVLFIAVGIIIPSRETISLGFDPTGSLHDPGPSETLLLLPILSAFAFLLDLITGLFLYRREDTRIISYVLWISTSILPIILLVSLIFII